MKPVAVISLGTLVALTGAVLAVGGPLPGEVGLIRWLQEIGRPAPSLADAVGATTGSEGNLVIGAPVGAWVIRRHGRPGVIAALICLVAMLVVQPLSKEVIDRDRPTEEQVEIRTGFSSRSYPSGHSLSTATVWGAAALYVGRTGRRRSAAVLVVPIVCTALASGIHGVHWVSDSLAGTIVGGWAAWLAVERVRRPVPPAMATSS